MRTPIAMAVVLGSWACGDAGDSPHATVVTLSQVPSSTAPHGKASVQRLAEGQHAFVGRLVLEPNVAIPLHRDASEETIHVVEGTGTLTIDGKSFAIGPGATAFMPAMAEVRFENGPDRLVALQVFAGGDSQRKYDGWDLASSAP